MNGLRFTKTYLDLGRVDVDVDTGRIQCQEQGIGRMPVMMENITVGLPQGMLRGLVTDKAAIDVEVLCVAAGLRVGRAGHETLQGQTTCVCHDVQGRFDEVLAQQGGDTVLQGLYRQAPYRFTIVAQQELNIRVRQSDTFEGGQTVGVFSVLGFEELAPGRGVEVQVDHFHCCARCMGRRFNRVQGAINGNDLVRMRLVGRAAGQGQSRHRGHTGQTFAAKPQRADFFKLFQ